MLTVKPCKYFIHENRCSLATGRFCSDKKTTRGRVMGGVSWWDGEALETVKSYMDVDTKPGKNALC